MEAMQFTDVTFIIRWGFGLGKNNVATIRQRENHYAFSVPIRNRRLNSFVVLS